jgi:hypothetical protein
MTDRHSVKRAREVFNLRVIGIAFARLHATGFPKTQADNSDQGGERQNLGHPYGHFFVLYVPFKRGLGQPADIREKPRSGEARGDRRFTPVRRWDSALGSILRSANRGRRRYLSNDDFSLSPCLEPNAGYEADSDGSSWPIASVGTVLRHVRCRVWTGSSELRCRPTRLTQDGHFGVTCRRMGLHPAPDFPGTISIPNHPMGARQSLTRPPGGNACTTAVCRGMMLGRNAS